MRGGVGLMGEAGPEAIMPLAAAPTAGSASAPAGGGGAVHVTMNISTPDVAGLPALAEPDRGRDEPGDPARAAQPLKERTR